MAYTLDVTEEDVFTVLRAFILNATGTSLSAVVTGPINRAATPMVLPFVTMTPVLKEQLEFPHYTVSDPAAQPQVISTTMPTEFRVQLDFYGDSTASDAAQTVFSAFQDPAAFDFFSAQTIQGVYPLYVDSLSQAPMVTGEDSYEMRWMMQVNLQYNPSLSTTVQTASTLSVAVINVEATYQ